MQKTIEEDILDKKNHVLQNNNLSLFAHLFTIITSILFFIFWGLVFVTVSSPSFSEWISNFLLIAMTIIGLLNPIIALFGITIGVIHLIQSKGKNQKKRKMIIGIILNTLFLIPQIFIFYFIIEYGSVIGRM